MVHVFVVDDDPEIRSVLRCVLEATGYAATAAADGVSALDGLRASPYPLIVVLDLRMPRLHGAGVLATVAGDRELAQRHHFVLVTADPLPPPPALDALLASLDVPVVSKPFDVDTLLDMVAHLAYDAHAPQGVHGARAASAPARVHWSRRTAKAGGGPGPTRSLTWPGSR